MDAIANSLQGVGAARAYTAQPVSRTAQEEADPLASTATEPSRYYSPVVRIDSETQRTVLQYRDGSDGKVLMQYPSEKQLEAYRSSAKADRAKEAEKSDTGAKGKQAEGGSGEPGTMPTGQEPNGSVKGSSPAPGLESSEAPIVVPSASSRTSAPSPQGAQPLGGSGDGTRSRVASISA